MINTENIFTLNHRIAFYVPSTQGLDGKITRVHHETRTRQVAVILTELFGGATTSRNQGYYKANSGQIVVEDVNIVIAFTSDDTLATGSQKLLQLAQNKAQEWRQESILVEIDGKAYLIEQ